MAKSNELTADGAAQVAAMLTDTIVREHLKSYTPDSLFAYTFETFRRCLDELMGSSTHAATLEQITSKHNLPPE